MIIIKVAPITHQEAFTPIRKHVAWEFQNYRLSRNHEMQICARKAYFTRKKNQRERINFSPLTLLFKELVAWETKAHFGCFFTKRQDYKDKKTRNALWLSACWKVLHTSAGTQSLHFSIPPHPSASACLSSYTPNIPPRMLSVWFLPPMGPISSFSFPLSPYKNQGSKNNARRNAGLEPVVLY